MERKSVRELKKLARNSGIDTTGMSRATLEYEIAKLEDNKVKNIYQPIAQLGVKGRDGKVFRLYKFRTMFLTKDMEIAKRGESLKTKQSDNRISWFGYLLRRTNLDEYPQFLNVFSGSMSTVGPRPHMVGEDISLENNLSRYRLRRLVKPGITGWAAINGLRGGTDDMQLMSKRTEYDIWYLENWSIWLDIKIIFVTIWQMITFKIPKAY